MNLHLTIDQKFILSFIEIQEEYSLSQNKYILFSNEEKIDKSLNALIKRSLDHDNFEKLIQQERDVKTIYFHGLSTFFQELILKFRLWENFQLVWVFYGGELFGSNQFTKKFLLPKSQKLFRKMYPELFFKAAINPIQLRRNIINLIHYKGELIRQETKLIEAIKKIHFVAHFIYGDYQKFILPINSEIKWINWNYALNNKDTKISRKSNQPINIILGNSASIYNNHLDGLDYLKHHKTNEVDWNLLVPLSYNDRRGYSNEIIKYGTILFGEKFQPITGFLPKTEYEELISSVSAAIYFNLRSQAAGNIFWFIRQEIPVFLKKDNNLFDFLQSIGIEVLSIEKDLPQFLKDPQSIALEQLEENRKSLEKFFSKDNVASSYRNLLEIND